MNRLSLAYGLFVLACPLISNSSGIELSRSVAELELCSTESVQLEIEGVARWSELLIKSSECTSPLFNDLTVSRELSRIRGDLSRVIKPSFGAFSQCRRTVADVLSALELIKYWDRENITDCNLDKDCLELIESRDDLKFSHIVESDNASVYSTPVRSKKVFDLHKDDPVILTGRFYLEEEGWWVRVHRFRDPTLHGWIQYKHLTSILSE